MSRLFLSRLWLDGLAAALLLLGLAYWWLGNAVHELAGTAMFLLLIAHNLFNRRWWGSVRRTQREPRSLFNVAVTFVLLIAMLALLVTSVLISKALSPFLPPWGGFTVRQIHTLAAYWVLVVVAIHLGLRWPMLMGLARNLSGIRKPSALRSLALRVIASGIALCGVWSVAVLGLGGKLSMQMTLDWWNFEEAVAGFFLHCMAVAGLVMALTYYGLRLVQSALPAKRRQPRETSSAEPAQAPQG
jgi:Na+/proline symporter